MPRLHAPLALFPLLACAQVDPSTAASSTTTVASTTTTPSDPTTTTADHGTSAESTPTEGFIMTPDHGGVNSLECDPFAQACPPGQKCVPWVNNGGSAWNATKCVDITGDGAPGDPCFAPEGAAAGIDDCALGAICWDLDETDHGTCIGQCAGSSQTQICPPKFSCSFGDDGVLNLCFRDCDPLLQNCPGGDTCIPPNLGGYHFTCLPDGSGEFGKTNDSCEFVNACDEGLVCIDPLDASSACDPLVLGCCQPFCELPDATCPNPDQQCVPFFDPMLPDIPPGYDKIGTCRIPS